MKIEEMHLALNTTRNDLSSANEKIHLLSSEKCDLDGKLSSIIKEKKAAPNFKNSVAGKKGQAREEGICILENFADELITLKIRRFKKWLIQQ